MAPEHVKLGLYQSYRIDAGVWWVACAHQPSYTLCHAACKAAAAQGMHREYLERTVTLVGARLVRMMLTAPYTAEGTGEAVGWLALATATVLLSR